MLEEGVRALAVLERDATSDGVETAEALAVPVVERERLPEAVSDRVRALALLLKESRRAMVPSSFRAPVIGNVTREKL
jgi:hypothetical protein